MSLELKALGIEDAEAFGCRAVGGLCEHSFANLMIWRDFDRPSLARVGETLCVHLNPLNEAPFFLEPLGPGDPLSAAEACLAHTGRISRASASFASLLPAGAFSAAEIRDHYDYVYRVKDLAELKGRRYDGKRSHIRRLIQAHPEYRYIPLDRGMEGLALDSFDRWQALKRAVRGGTISELSFGCQRAAIARAFEGYDELGLMGGALAIGDDLAGFAIGSRLNGDTACLHLCYGRPDIPGSFQTLLWEACRKTFAGFERINLEQDLGLEGLRKFKRSYHPAELKEKYEIVRNPR